METQAPDPSTQLIGSLTALFQHVPIGLVLLGRDLTVTWINAAAAGFVGRTPPEVVGKIWYEVVPSLKARLPIYERVFCGEAVSLVESRVALPQGDRYFDVHYAPVRSGDMVTGLCALVTDVTDRVQAKLALGDSTTRLRATLEQLPALVWTTDAALRLTSAMGARPGQARTWEEDAVGLDPCEYFDVDDPDRRLLAAHRTALTGERVACEFRWGDGTFLAHLQPLRGPDDPIAGVIGVAQDVTDQRQLERQLRGAQRMEAIGKLTGGIAHDFNNILQVIHGCASFISERFEQNDPAMADIDTIQDATARAASLTGQLMAFARQQIQRLDVIDLNTVVRELDKMLRRVIGEDIELTTLLAEDPLYARADKSQIGQILVNLVVNARDAMPQGGKLTIETTLVDLDAQYARTHAGASSGPHVVLEITDTGTGMDEHTRERIFEPFFTTKELGRGAGLGLATVYGIVKQSGGSIFVYSEPGRGSTFKVYLPRIEGPSPIVQPAHTTAGHLTGTETVLLVEDDPLVRRVTRQMLRAHGYTVVEAGQADEALRMCHVHGTSIDLLLTDIVMPLMSGPELAARLKEVYPHLQVLYMSGYAAGATVGHGLLAAGTHVVSKPFTTRELLLKVRTALGDTAGNG